MEWWCSNGVAVCWCVVVVVCGWVGVCMCGGVWMWRVGVRQVCGGCGKEYVESVRAIFYCAPTVQDSTVWCAGRVGLVGASSQQSGVIVFARCLVQLMLCSAMLVVAVVVAVVVATQADLTAETNTMTSPHRRAPSPVVDRGRCSKCSVDAMHTVCFWCRTLCAVLGYAVLYIMCRSV